MLGNINNLILLRVLDAETQQYVTDSLPKTRPEKPAAYPGQHHTLPEPTALHWQCRRAPGRGEGDLFPPALLGQLPDLHYLAVLAGGRIVKGRLPILGTPKEAA